MLESLISVRDGTVFTPHAARGQVIGCGVNLLIFKWP